MSTGNHGDRFERAPGRMPTTRRVQAKGDPFRCTLVLGLCAVGATVASGEAVASEWSVETHTLAIGDFNGDGKSDLLYIAKDPGHASGIAASNGSAPNVDHQSWPSNFLGIPWHSGTYNPVIGDYNGDGRSDLLLQATSSGGWSYLLYTNAEGRFDGTSIHQSIPAYCQGLYWPATDHRIIAGNFVNNGAHPTTGKARRELLLQATKRGGTNAIISMAAVSTAYGQRAEVPCGSGAAQTWGDGTAGFQWSFAQAIVHAGDFNNDGYDDVFVHAKPDIVIIDYDIPFPVPTYRPNSFGIVLAASGGGLQSSAWQYWSRMQNGIDWSAANTNAVVADYSGDGRADILLQSKRSGGTNYWFAANSSGQFSVGSATTTLTNVGTGDAFLLLAANFSGQTSGISGQARPVFGLYRQATTAAGGANGFASDVAGSFTSHDYSSVQPLDAGLTNKVTPGTAVGAVPGELSVDPTGGASYRIPIALPPGVAGVQPELSLAYSSRATNGLVGVGWTITGLSAISRCSLTMASDNITDGVDFDGNDAFCLDGQRLKVINATSNGAVGAQYRTELESFQRVTSAGGVAGDPGNWEVWDKSGLMRSYGTTDADTAVGDDSRIEARKASGPTSTDPAMVWAVKLVKDRFDNFIEFKYEQDLSNSSFWPTEITYGSQVASVASAKTVVGRIVFTYFATQRPDPAAGYIAGGYSVGLKKLLQKVTIYARQNPQQSGTTAATTKVREYFLNYEQSPTSGLAHLSSITLCDGGSNAAQSCFKDTKFQWQHGYRGFAEAYSTLVRFNEADHLKPLDFNADGRTDYAYVAPSNPMAPRYWASRESTLRSSQVTTSHLAVDPEYALAMDYDSDGYQDLVQRTSSGMYQALRGGATGFQAMMTTSTSAFALSYQSDATAIGDFNGDGRQDLAYVTYGATSNAHANGSLIAAQLNSAFGLSSTPVVANPSADNRPGDHRVTGRKEENSSLRIINFDGDDRDDLLFLVSDCATIESPPDHFQTDCQPQARVFSMNETGTAFNQTWPQPAVSSYWGAAWAKLKLTDTNGDGLTDILYFHSTATGWRLLIGTGNPATQWSSSGAWNAASINVPYCVDQWTYFGGGTIPAHCSSVAYALTQQKLDDAVVYDYNRDGRTDVLFPEGSQWLVLPGAGAGFQNVVWGTGRNAVQPGSAMVLDDRADGIPDLIFVSGSDPDSFYHLYHGRGPVSGMIEKITDGLGAETTIQYGVLTAMDPTSGGNVVYKGHQPMIEGPQPAFPYSHFVAPIPVVYQFAADNGRTNAGGTRGSVRTTYEYYGLKAHRQGRGMLGFSEVRSWNDNTDIQTINRHVQTFPYTGMVLVSRQMFKGQATYMGQLVDDVAPNLMFDYVAECETNARCSAINPSIITYTAGGPVSETINVANGLTWANGNLFFPYVRSSTAKVFALTDAGAGSVYKQTTTEYLSTSGSSTEAAYDDYGNPYRIRVTTNGGSPGVDEHIVTTTNTYTNHALSWCLGRLTATTVQHQKPANVSGNTTALTNIVREATFAYQSGQQCVLQTENTEPTADGGQWRLTKTYGYDAYGNRASETIGGYGIAAAKEHTTSSNYSATLGQFPSVVTNAEGHSEYPAWDGRFGLRTQVIGPNGLTAEFSYDSFGRKIKETPIAALASIFSEQSFYWCTGTGACVPNGGGIFAVKTTATDGSLGYVEFDRLGREIRARKLHFDGGWLNTEKHYDPLGQEYLVSDPYRDGQNKCWTFRRFDALSRVVKEWMSNTEEACTAAALGYERADSDFNSPIGAWKRMDFSHDLVSANGIATRIVSNASDTSGYATARTAYKIVNVVGRTRHVLDEMTAGGCPWNGSLAGSSASCVQTEYDYDAQGNTTYVKQLDTTRTPNVMVETKVSFNRRAFKMQMVDPDMGTWDYNYNVFGELTWQRDAKLQVATLDYDELGRMTSRIEGSEGTTTWEYDTGNKAIGKLARVYAPNGFEEQYFYDSYGRLEQTKRLVDGQYFWVDQTYDSQGRVDTLKYPNSVSSSSSGSSGPDSERLRVRHSYNAFGYLASVNDAASSTVFWTADEVDVLGNVKKETLGNGLVTRRFHDRVTGYLNDLKTGTTANATSVQSMQFGFDQASNLRIRKDTSTHVNGGSGAREEFGYDKLYRLTQTQLFASHSGAVPSSSETYAYDPLGNLSSKGAYTGYQYGPRSNCSNQVVRPHAVYEVTASSATRRYCYDANGNLTSAVNAAYDTATWWTANLARKVSKGSSYSEFRYGPDRARYRQVAYQNSANQTTTLYVGALYEKLTKVSSGNTTVEHVHYVRAGSQVIALWKRTGGGPSVNYLHGDHLGSVTAVTDAAGVLTERFSFDPWGKRRQRDNWNSVPPGTYPTAVPVASPRGFTGHEQVDALGIIHMNGRIYDPEIGEFLSADPFVQFPESTQGLNRYSYVGNNPLSYTDPSGFFKLGDVIKIVVIAVVSYFTGGLAASYLGPTAGAFVGGFTAGFLASGGDLRAGLIGGISAGMFSALSQAVMVGWSDAAVFLAGAAWSGTLAAAQGGDFWRGFVGTFINAGVMVGAMTAAQGLVSLIQRSSVAGTDQAPLGVANAAADKNANAAPSSTAAEALAGSASVETSAGGVRVSIDVKVAKMEGVLQRLKDSGAELRRLDDVKNAGLAVEIRLGRFKWASDQHTQMHTFRDRNIFAADKIVIEVNPGAQFSPEMLNDWASALGHELQHAGQAAIGRSLHREWWKNAVVGHRSQAEAYRWQIKTASQLGVSVNYLKHVSFMYQHHTHFASTCLQGPDGPCVAP